jgi:hypothetical protein
MSENGENTKVQVDESLVGRVMDKAAVADRRALFAAVQAAVAACVDLSYRGTTFDDAMRRIERALDVGGPYGSREHLSSLDG